MRHPRRRPSQPKPEVKRCRTGKARFRSRLDALLALMNTGRNDSRRPKDECRVYRCPECSGWHLTSQGRRPRPA